MSLKYYYLSWEEKEEMTIARAPERTLGYELAKAMVGHDKLPFILESSGNLGDLPDYLPNSIAWPMMSTRFVELVTRYIAGRKDISWIEALVKCDENLIRYQIPRFDRKLDILNEAKTIFAKGDFIVKAHLSLSKTEGLHFFSLPDTPITTRIVISEILKKEVTTSGFTGITFEKVASS